MSETACPMCAFSERPRSRKMAGNPECLSKSPPLRTSVEHCRSKLRGWTKYSISLVILLSLLVQCSVGFEEEEEFSISDSSPSSYFPNPSSSPPLQISPTPSSSLVNSVNPNNPYSSISSTISSPNTYFITGLANTIRHLNSTLVSLKSQGEPFQLHFRTACSFGNLVYDVSLSFLLITFILLIFYSTLLIMLVFYSNSHSH